MICTPLPFNVLLLAVCVLAQQDNGSWEFLRGPCYDGVSKEVGIIDEWPEEGPPVLWSRKLGQGYSGFTARGDRVFTQYQTLTSQYVVCLDASTGDTVWQYCIGWSHKPAGLYPGPRSTPTLNGELLYFTAPSGQVGCLKQSNGEAVWLLNLYEKFNAGPVEFGYSISPTVVEEKVLLPVGATDASIVALDKNDGTLIWQSAGDAISHAGLLPITRNGRRLIIGYLKNSLVLIDLRSGKKLSEVSLSAGYDEHSAWPIYKEPHLWISAPFRRGSQLYEVTDSDPPTIRLLRQSYEMSNDVSSSVLVDGALYGFDIVDVQSKVHRNSRGHFRAVDFLTGEILWSNGSSKRRVPEPGDIGHAAFIYADGKLILLNDSGELILGRVDRQRFEEIGRASLLADDICWTQPTLLQGRVFLRNHKRAMCVYLGDPRLLNIDRDQLMHTSDIHVRRSLDWANLIFSVEPEYAMDAPASGWLVSWFVAIWVTGALVASALATLLVLLGTAIGKWIGHRKQLPASRTSVLRRRRQRMLRRWIAASLGVMGTTLYSSWLSDFVFTWPLTVFVLFEVCVYQAAVRRGDSKERIWAGRCALLAFFASIVAYYLLCRRLSLAFEWAFLTRFPFAMPFLMLARNQSNKQGWRAQWLEWLWNSLALVVFYWAGAGLVLWKY